MDKNLVILKGHISNDPKVSENGEKTSVRFTLACNRRGENAGADFIPCVAFGKTAELLKKWMEEGNLKKGTHIEIYGSFKTGNYKKEDNTIYTYECLIDTAEYFYAPPQSQTSAPQQPQAPAQSQAPQHQTQAPATPWGNNNGFPQSQPQVPQSQPATPQQPVAQNPADAFAQMGSGLPWG